MKVHFVILMMILSATLTGCVETIVMDPHEEALPVVVNCVLKDDMHNTFFTDGSAVQSVSVLYAKGKSTEDYIPVDNAVVYAKVESDPSHETEETITFSYTDDGLYTTEGPVRIKPKTKYTLYVEVPGRETVWAETVSLPEVTLDDYFYEMVISESEDLQLFYPIYLYQTVNADGDCALWIDAQEYTTKGLRALEFLVTDHPDVDNFNITGKSSAELSVLGNQMDRSDMEIRESQEMLKSYLSNSPLYEKHLHIRNIESSDPFSVYAGPVWYLNLESQNNYGKYDSPDVFHPEIEVPWPYNFFFVYNFHIVNRDLDIYMRDNFVHDYEVESYMTTLYSTENIYSNIRGGTGIFGCERIFSKAFQTNGRLNCNWPEGLFND